MRDIKTLDLNLLKTLDALLDERSVTRAADRLGLTQPAVSGMLTRLRHSFDDPLFVRSQRGIIPTPRAQSLAGPVKHLLADASALLRPMAFDPVTADFSVSVAATDYAVQAVMLPFLTSLRHLAPGVRVAVRPVDPLALLTQFERADVDLALMTPDDAPPDLHARRLFDEDYVCVLRHGHPDTPPPGHALSLDRFCSLDHALVSYAGQPFRGITDDALAAIGRHRRVVLSMTSFLALAAVLQTTDLIAVVPRRLARDIAGLIITEPPLPITGFTKLAVWHDRTHRAPEYRWVRSLLFDVVAGTGAARQTGDRTP